MSSTSIQILRVWAPKKADAKYICGFEVLLMNPGFLKAADWNKDTKREYVKAEINCAPGSSAKLSGVVVHDRNGVPRVAGDVMPDMNTGGDIAAAVVDTFIAQGGSVPVPGSVAPASDTGRKAEKAANAA